MVINEEKQINIHKNINKRYKMNILTQIKSKIKTYTHLHKQRHLKIPRFGHPFETPLLVQSILINLVMLALLHVCALVCFVCLC